eukprot:PhF_6_TR38135/c0_g1_i2/m.56953
MVNILVTSDWRCRSRHCLQKKLLKRLISHVRTQNHMVQIFKKKISVAIHEQRFKPNNKYIRQHNNVAAGFTCFPKTVPHRCSNSIRFVYIGLHSIDITEDRV